MYISLFNWNIYNSDNIISKKNICHWGNFALEKEFVIIFKGRHGNKHFK